MATSNANICNQALIRLGIRGALIDDLVSDQHEEAEVFNAIFENVRDACLAAFPWPFATLRKTLNQIAAAQEPARDGWAYVYAVPNDCLQERKIWQTGYDPRGRRADQEDTFVIEKSSIDDSRVLLCDLPAVTLLYTARFTDSSRFHPLFVDALAWLLAAEAAPALTGKEAKEDQCRKRFWQKIQEAQVAALNGQREDQPPTTESIAARS
jgi:hypothetical protein